MGKARRHNVVLGALAWLVIVSACQAPPGSPSTPVAPATPRSAEATSTPEPTPTPGEPTLTPTGTPTSAPVASATPSDFDVITLANVEHVQALGRPVTSPWKIAQLVFRPRATWVAEPLEEGGIELWDFHTGEMVKSLAEAGTDIELIVVSPDGRRLASVSPTKERISVWDLDNFAHVGTFAFRGYQSTYVFGFIPLVGSFSRDDRYLAVAGCLQIKFDRNAICQDAGAVIYDLTTNEISTELAGYQHETTGVAFSPNGELLALAGYGKSTPQADLLVWDVHQNRPLAALPSGYPLCL
jgi:WD40 repeat protein